MKYSIVASLLFASAAVAQDGFSLGDLPNCGKVTCLLPAFTSSGCDIQDINCLCTSPEVREAVTCIRNACEGEDLSKVFTFANTACKGKPGFPISTTSNSTGSNATNGTGSASPSPSGGADDEPNAAGALGISGLLLGGMVGAMGVAGLL